MTCVLGTSDGAELGSAGHEYAHAAMETTLASSGAALLPHWALQDLADCIKALQEAVPAAPRAAGIRRRPLGSGALDDPPTFLFQYRPDSGQFAVA